MLAWSAIPAGTLAGGAIVKGLGADRVEWVYGAIGVIIVALALFFKAFTALGRAEEYLPENEQPEEERASEAEPAAA